jgi:hypothetical protein
MTKFAWTISILLLALVPFARGQQTSSDTLSDVDKTAIVEAVLKLEWRNQGSVPDFARRTAVASQNIQFVEPSRLSNQGFTLVTAAELAAARRENIIEYILFKEILVRDGVAVVTLSHVTEGRPCFGPFFSRELKYTYQARPTIVGWIAELTQRPIPPIRFPDKRFAPL